MRFWDNAAPVIKVTIDNAVLHIQTNVAPSIHGAALRLIEHVDKQMAPAVKGSIDGSLARLHETFGGNFEKVPKVALQTAEEVVAWFAANPGKTAIIITSGVILFAPGLVTGPALVALGFGAEGVGAGKILNPINSCAKRAANKVHRKSSSGFSGRHRKYSVWELLRNPSERWIWRTRLCYRQWSRSEHH